MSREKEKPPRSGGFGGQVRGQQGSHQARDMAVRQGDQLLFTASQKINCALAVCEQVH